MGKEPTGGDLELRDEIRLHKRGWIIKRVTWVFFALVLVAAVAGFLGPGPASKTIMGKKGSALWIEYERFGRYRSPSELKINFKAPGREEVHVWIDRKFAEHLEIERFDPVPFKNFTSEDRLYFVFLQEKETPSGMVILDVEPIKFGANNGRIGLRDGPDLELKQFIYP
jgi:hypothetical protein